MILTLWTLGMSICVSIYDERINFEIISLHGRLLAGHIEETSSSPFTSWPSVIPGKKHLAARPAVMKCQRAYPLLLIYWSHAMLLQLQ